MKKGLFVSMFFVSLIVGFFVLHFIIENKRMENVKPKYFSEKIINNQKIDNKKEFLSFYDISFHGKEVFFKFNKEENKGELFINSNVNDFNKDQNDLISLIDTLKTKKEISFGDDGDDLLLRLKDKKGLVSIPYIKNENGILKAYLTFSYILEKKENGVFEVN